jgi:hypothetical protein
MMVGWGRGRRYQDWINRTRPTTPEARQPSTDNPPTPTEAREYTPASADHALPADRAPEGRAKRARRRS